MIGQRAADRDDPAAPRACAGRQPEIGPGLGRSRELTAAQLRRLMISEFRDWLGSRTNRNGRPFQADTISGYADAASHWMPG